MQKFEYKKYITQDGLVAVLVSPVFGAGWSTWAHDPDVKEALIFDSVLVELVLSGDFDSAARYAEHKYDAYAGGAEDLTVKWVPQGEQFEIAEYDGSERLRIISQCKFHTA